MDLLLKAKSQLEQLAKEVWEDIPYGPVDNPIKRKIDDVKRLQEFTERFPDRAAVLSNVLLDEYEREFGTNQLDDFRDDLIDICQSIILEKGKTLAE